MKGAFSRWLLKKMGWKIEGTFPHHLKKGMIVVLHHTSNWDFPLGLLLRSAVNAKINFIGKKSLFAWPHGYIFRALGGHPIDQKGKMKLVDKVAQLYENQEYLMLTIAPEGTRKKVNKLKTGFFYIAQKAKVPIIMVKFDFKNKILGWAPPFMPGENIEDTLNKMKEYYKDTEGLIKKDSFVFK